MKGFISLLDYSTEELIEILDRADKLYELWHHNKMPQSLRNKNVGLWFYGQGFRNRIAFELGAKSMGAKTSYIPGELGIHEPLEDIGHYLKNWFTFLVIRAKNHEDLMYLVNNVNIPIINARTNLSHPCEIIGDLQFIRRHRKILKDLKMVFVGEVTNLCMSWFEASVKFPIEIIQIAPKKYLADKKLIDTFNNNSKNNHLLKLKEDSIFLPCPPVTRGEEVSNEVMHSDICLNFVAKEFLLHSQNAIMEIL